jgi:hypothetical protein
MPNYLHIFMTGEVTATYTVLVVETILGTSIVQEIAEGSSPVLEAIARRAMVEEVTVGTSPVFEAIAHRTPMEESII